MHDIGVTCGVFLVDLGSGNIPLSQAAAGAVHTLSHTVSRINSECPLYITKTDIDMDSLKQ